MANRKDSGTTPKVKTADYRHTREKRTNIPPAKIAAEGAVPKVPKARYYYSPHLPPVLRFDPTGSADRLPELIAEAGRRPLKPEEQRLLADALRQQEPWLEWATKREQHEKGFFEVDPVALHIHERVSAQAIVRVAMREDVQRDLFADPQLPYQQAVQFYRHDMEWVNRLILGDSLQVMSSLARRENLAGKVQMIYVDPPYAVNFRSNFQPLAGFRSVGARDEDLTREIETVRAYRDTWHLGAHSYLTYLRDRLIVARDLLADTGSIFVQINDEHVHLVRDLLDEVFGRSRWVSQIAFTKGPGGLESTRSLSARFDYILWYCKNPDEFRPIRVYESDEADSGKFNWLELPNGHCFRLGADVDLDEAVSTMSGRLFADESLTKPGPGAKYEISFQDRKFNSGRRWWGAPKEALERALRAERVLVVGNTLRRKKYLDESPPKALDNLWIGLAGAADPVYVVQTNAEVIKRCMLMSTRPGDLVVDPTCGSGTTAYVAEQWGRRWITIDTSRVALLIARQRILTARFEHYKIRDAANGDSTNPAAGFEYKKATNVTFSQVSQNVNLDPILDKHEPILEEALQRANALCTKVPEATRQRLLEKLRAKERGEGSAAITEADRRRWVLPRQGERWRHWEVPFDTDADWPRELQEAVSAYRRAWQAKIADVNDCIRANAGHEDLVSRPEVVKGVVRVSGPFTVEGVRPAELSLDEQGLFGGAPEALVSSDAEVLVERQNVNAYLTQMVQHLRADGVTFLGNRHRKFARVEPLFETATGSIVHAEGLWEGEDTSGPNTVAIGFGPQYGPVTAEQVEELVRASKRYDELVIAGFSFDAAASAAIQEASHPKLRIHQAYVRPDINPGMEGLLKVTGQSQLFTVFGQPEIKVQPADDGQFIVKLEGVDVYDPVENAVRSTGAEKVAAWFLDSDYDGRCFCITQAFFPRQDAWEKIAKALGGNADAEAFAAFGGTTSLPFRPGKHRRIAVKVIDPRGNEIMTVRTLKA